MKRSTTGTTIILLLRKFVVILQLNKSTKAHAITEFKLARKMEISINNYIIFSKTPSK